MPAARRRVAQTALLAFTGCAAAASLLMSGPSITTPGIPPGEPYGSAIGADSLANAQVGGLACGCRNARVSFRFLAGTSAPLDTIRVYVIANGETGYSGGTGTTLRVSIREDDRSDAHAPSDSSLAVTTLRVANPSADSLRLIRFPNSPRLTEGVLYHAVFENIEDQPTANFISLNSLWRADGSADADQPRHQHTDWGQLADYGTGWETRPAFTPILALAYESGVAEGLGYIEVWSDSSTVIGGHARLRQQFTVTGGDRHVGSVSLRLQRSRGLSAVEVRLEDETGALIEDGAIPASAVEHDHAGWVTDRFGSPAVLRSGQRYQFVVSAPDESRYVTSVLREGALYAFPATSYFADGFAESSHDGGATWNGFKPPGGISDLTQGDLQFYFE